MCVLTQNIINEKIYLCLWFWYAFLGPVSLLFIFFRNIFIYNKICSCWGVFAPPPSNLFLLQDRGSNREAFIKTGMNSCINNWLVCEKEKIECYLRTVIERLYEHLIFANCQWPLIFPLKPVFRTWSILFWFKHAQHKLKIVYL